MPTRDNQNNILLNIYHLNDYFFVKNTFFYDKKLIIKNYSIIYFVFMKNIEFYSEV